MLLLLILNITCFIIHCEQLVHLTHVVLRGVIVIKICVVVVIHVTADNVPKILNECEVPVGFGFLDVFFQGKRIYFCIET